jgi:hypothetical protein
MLLRRFLLLALTAGALAGCGDDSPPAVTPTEDPESEVAHIHGLGINPADGALVIATHTGLFRAAPGETEAARVGDRRQDTMGFTVVGPDKFLGSGHPDARDELPPMLGLIRSDNAGQDWTSVSLMGDVDFHVLRAQGRQIYGVDSQSGALLVSSDGGASWQRRSPPGTLLDIAIDPADPRRIVSSGERGLLLSRDAGASWRPMSSRLVGMLAWTDALVVVDPSGTVHRADAEFGRFGRVGRIEGEPSALAVHDDVLLVATHENRVLTSDDGGRTWSQRLAA